MVQSEIAKVQQSEEANNRTKKRYNELNSTQELIIDDARGYTVRTVNPMDRMIHEFTTFSKRKNLIWAFAEADILLIVQIPHNSAYQFVAIRR